MAANNNVLLVLLLTVALKDAKGGSMSATLRIVVSDSDGNSSGHTSECSIDGGPVHT